MLFGLDVPATVDREADQADLAETAERLDLDFVSINDHLLDSGPRYEAWTLLTWLAASTLRIRVVSRVLGVPFRHPVLLAKMGESLDRLSGGRFTLGLGAGSGEREFAAMGLRSGSIRERVEALEETMRILRGLWSGDTLTFDGRFHTIAEARLEPKPAHAIPIWLGTVGPRGLELTGRLADGWIPSLAYAPPERAPAMIQVIQSAAERAGRDPGRLELIYNLELAFGDQSSTGAVCGTPDAIVRQLRSFLDAGFTGFNFQLRDPDWHMAAEKLAADVIPALTG